jgi:hypothetical protein
MKASEREIYFKLIGLCREHWSGLCNICRCAEFTGDCLCGDMECHCGIEKIAGDCYGYWSGDDCWAFKPRWTLEDATDAVGLILQGKYPDMYRCKELGKRK